MNVYFVYKVLTNRIRALIIAAGYLVTSSGSPRPNGDVYAAFWHLAHAELVLN